MKEGTAVPTISYAPFGQAYTGSGTFRMAVYSDGNGLDASRDAYNDTGSLDDFEFRRYSPTQGRWISPDPAGLAAVDPTNPQSWNRYAYVRDNPLAMVDPKGLVPGGGPKYFCGGAPLDLVCNSSPSIGGGTSSSLNVVFGNDMFDAIAGGPGTYLTLDMYGNLSWGFSSSLWSLTQNFLDANPYLRGSLGLPVVVQNFGLSQTVSGIVPEYVSLLSEQSQVLASMPSRFAQDMAVAQDNLIAAGVAPGLAAMQALQFEVNMMQNYYSDEPDAANWLGAWQGVNQGFAAWLNRRSSVFPPYVPGH